MAVASILVALLGVAASIWFGDWAGTQAAMRHEDIRLAEARISALQALRNQVDAARALCQHNSSVGAKNDYLAAPARLLTSGFETAFLRTESPLLSEQGTKDPTLMACIGEYLALGHSVNTMVELYLALPSALGTHGQSQVAMQDVQRKIGEHVREAPPLLDKIDELLLAELMQARESLATLRTRALEFGLWHRILGRK